MPILSNCVITNIWFSKKYLKEGDAESIPHN